jgi:hypothetical protein
MTMAGPAKKKVVRVQSTPASRASEPTWKPTPQAKSQATRLRIIAVVLWLVAIATEAVAGIWAWKQKDWSTTNMVLLIATIVVIGVLAVVGDFLWKRANRADPASRSEPVRFFIQNQLGAIIGIVAFLPLIVLILLNKNMNAQQKGIAGGIAGVALIVAVAAGVSLNPPSVEQNTTQQYTAEVQTVMGYSGQNLVFWTKEGTVYHLCQAASAVNEQSKDNTIYSGTVADAHAAGKERLTLQVSQELKQCGFATPVPSGS